MGSGAWFKSIISKKKVKGNRSEKFNAPGYLFKSNKVIGKRSIQDFLLKPRRYSAPEKSSQYKEENCSQDDVPTVADVASGENCGLIGLPLEDIAALRIQTAFRGYGARKMFRKLKGSRRLQNLIQYDTVKKQASATLNHLHSWSRIQTEIRDRRVHMVTEGHLKQKKLENQLKLEAKLHDLEVEWSGGSETKDEALSRIHQREEAALRRERTMAYAFSHQWRVNSNTHMGGIYHDLSKANWGWSWMDRWIAARPWETWVSVKSSPKKAQSCNASKISKTINSPITKAQVSIKSFSPSGKAAAMKPRKLSYEDAEKNGHQKGEHKSRTAEEMKTKEHALSS